MTERVFLHVGLPKTGTTYLQRTLWRNKEILGRAGLLLPGRHQRRHLLASLDILDDPSLASRPGDVESPWADLVDESLAWTGDVLITHEFFGSASEAQAARAVGSFPDAEVHAIITARAMVELGISRWQEWVRNGGRRPIDDYPSRRRLESPDEWGWGSFDLGEVLDRWGSVLPHEHVHVLPMTPEGDDPTELFSRMLTLIGYADVSVEMPHQRANTSLGVVETELLRRINRLLTGFTSAADRGTWIRGYLASPQVMATSGEKFRPGPETLAELVSRGERSVELLQTGGYDVVGDLDLLTPPDVTGRRHPSEVSDAEQLESAVRVIAELMEQVRSLTRRSNALTKEMEGPSTRVSVARFAKGVASKVRKEGPS